MFASNDDERVHHLAEVEKMCEVYTLDQLTTLNNNLAASSNPKEVFLQVRKDAFEITSFASEND